MPRRDVRRVFRTFNAAAAAFQAGEPPIRGESRVTSEPAAQSRTLHVGMLARVEGEASMHVQVLAGQVTDVELRIFEPPRFFEALLRGRAGPSRRTSPPGSAGSARSPTR